MPAWLFKMCLFVCLFVCSVSSSPLEEKDKAADGVVTIGTVGKL